MKLVKQGSLISYKKDMLLEEKEIKVSQDLPILCDIKKVYTVDEIQEILGIGLSTTYKLIKEKKFHSVKVGQRVLVSKKSFDDWLQI